MYDQTPSEPMSTERAGWIAQDHMALFIRPITRRFDDLGVHFWCIAVSCIAIVH
jgi:hypothetical protein